MNNLPDERERCRRVLSLCRFGVLSLALAFAGLTPLRAAEAPEPLTPCTAEPTDMTIHFGDLIDCNIDVISDSDNFRFAGAADSLVVVSLLFTGTYVDNPTRPVAYLYAPDSTTPLVTLLPCSGCASDVLMGPRDADAKEVKLPVTGTYTIRVAEDGNNATLPYRLGLERIIPASPTAKTLCWDCSTGSQRIDPALDQDFFTFQAFKDATATLTLGDGSANPCVKYNSRYSICPIARLFGPDQTLLGELGPGSQAKDIKLPVTGVYTIRVNEYGNNNSETYGLTLGCLFPPAGLAECGPSQDVTGLYSSILPTARSVLVGTAATAFGTIINTSGVTVTQCYLALPGSPTLPAIFNYQTTNTSNQLVGSLNTPVDIPAGGTQSFVFGITPSASFDATDIPLVFDCANTVPAPSQTGLNTFLLSASTIAPPDLIAIGATPSQDGVLRIPGPAGLHAFGTAAVNIGASGVITATVDTGSVSLPLTLTLCQTNPGTGACLAPPAASVSSTVNTNQSVTYAVFAQAYGAIAFIPAGNRIFLRLSSGGIVRGATSVAVTTQ